MTKRIGFWNSCLTLENVWKQSDKNKKRGDATKNKDIEILYQIEI